MELANRDELFDIPHMINSAYMELAQHEVPSLHALYHLFCAEWMIASLFFLEVNADAYQLTEQCLQDAADHLEDYGLDYPSLEVFVGHMDVYQLIYEQDGVYKNDARMMVW